MSDFEFDTAAIRDLANGKGAFRLNARFWTARVGFDLERACYDLVVKDGAIAEFTRVQAFTGSYDVRIAGPAEGWAKLLQAVPPPRYDDIRFRGLAVGFTLEGDTIGHVAPYYGAIQDFIALLREARSGPAPARPIPRAGRRFDSAVGRYLYIDVDGVQHRLYFEEAGRGDIPLILQHTAGADSRQWRHVLEDPDYQRRCRMIAYDLPFHGRSLPPTGVRWWEREYRLTKDFLIKTILALCEGLELDRPAFMGCSVGGHLAPDLAFLHPDRFRAVIGINAGLATPPPKWSAYDAWDHPRVSSDWKAAGMMGNSAPTSPEAYRREIGWIYSQGGPPVLKGDVYYYSYEHDLTAEQARRIDTSKIGVYLLTGDYDMLAGENGTAELARNIPGAHFQIIPGFGHFGPAENPDAFMPYLLPVLEKIARTPLC